MNWTTLKPIDLSKIVKVDFPDEQYYKEEILDASGKPCKKQITIHHTVSGKGIDGDMSTWLGDAARIATHFIISREGVVYQCFSSKYWGHHIGVKSDFLAKKGFSDSGTRNVTLNKYSVSIELDSWGGFTLQNNQYINSYNKAVTDAEFINYPNKFRGYSYYEKYTEAQLKSLGELIIYICDKYAIPRDYNADMWDVSMNALSGKAGIYAHVSYRDDKSDCHPQPELIEMLKTLKSLK